MRWWWSPSPRGGSSATRAPAGYHCAKRSPGLSSPRRNGRSFCCSTAASAPAGYEATAARRPTREQTARTAARTCRRRLAGSGRGRARLVTARLPVRSRDDRPLPRRPPLHDHLDPRHLPESASARLVEAATMPSRTPLDGGNARARRRAHTRGSTAGRFASRPATTVGLVASRGTTPLVAGDDFAADRLCWAAVRSSAWGRIAQRRPGR